MIEGNKSKGESFEKLAFSYFKTDPKFQNIKNVWRQKDIPFDVQSLLGIPTNDIGIDLLLESVDGDFYPIQCKYHSDPNRAVGWKEASTFIGLLNSIHHFKAGYLCSNAYDVSSNYDKAHSGKPIVRLLGSIWDNVDSERTADSRPELVPLKPRPHQQKAINEAVEYFEKEGNSRGKLIFPCGAGKSLTGFWITQELSTQSILIAVPSLALVKQTLEVYLREIAANKKQARWLCVCSDQEIGTNEEVKMHTSDLGVPCTTDPIEIRNWLTQPRTQQQIVFTTYQSGRLVADIAKQEGLTFDLAILDEAHKTVGSTGKLFSYLLFDQNIEIRKRIFMTATERFYSGTKDDIVSMDDPDVYGEVFTQLTFKEAIDQQLLTDYKVITIDVAKKEIADFIRENKLVELDSKWGTETEARSLAAMIALRKAMKALPIRNAVSFHSSIAKAERNDKLQKHITATYNLSSISSYTVSGKMSTGQRDRIVNEFASKKGALITNSRCLTEGVDVPNIDCIVFADPRKSRIDIVQALGRTLRRKEGKDWGYVILPVVYDGDTHEIDNDNFQEIVSIIRGLAANDERVIEHFKDRQSLNATTGGGMTSEQFMFLTEALEESDFQDKIGIKIWGELSRFNWMPFEDAKQWVARIQGLKSKSNWEDYIAINSIPVNLPRRPDSAYRTEWQGWGDFLGTGLVASWLREYRSYQQARDFAVKLGLINQGEWFQYTKEASLPLDIPKAPHMTYKNKGWQGWGEFLGTGNIANFNRVFWDFETARAYVHSLRISKKEELKELARKGQLPPEIPTNPNRTYVNSGWKGWGDWTGTGNIASFNRKYRPFVEARSFARGLKLNGWSEWRSYVKNTGLPPDIPANPHGVYEFEGWQHIGDWLGMPNYQPRVLKAREFQEARAYVHKLGFTTVKQWKDYSKTKERPSDIPKSPETVYANKGFVDLYDWIGSRPNQWRDFEEAKQFVHTLKLMSLSEWRDYCVSGERPTDIPSNPNGVYPEYKSAGDWLGTETIRTDLKVFRGFKEARKYVQSQGLRSQLHWNQWKKQGNRPSDIPSNPNKTYKDFGWKGWRDFLGYDKKK
jgi:superfamily II DNA or RNA helicase